MYCNIWTTRVLESFAPARGDMHSPQATGRALSIHPAMSILYEVQSPLTMMLH